MTTIEFKKKPNASENTTIRVWVSTRAKFRKLAEYYNTPVTKLLDDLADQLIEGMEVEKSQETTTN